MNASGSEVGGDHAALSREDGRADATLMRPAGSAPIYSDDGRPVFFQEPAMDRFVSVLLNLASELWVQTERVANLSALLERKGLASADEIATSSREAANSAEREAELRAYIDRVLGALREPQGHAAEASR